MTGDAPPGSLYRLLGGLRAQTVRPESMEAVVVADHFDDSLQALAADLPFRCRLTPRPAASAAEARNAAVALSEGQLVLFLDADCQPAPDLVQRHLAAHRELGPDVAVLGAAPFTDEALASPLVRILDASAVLRPISTLDHGDEIGWGMFRASNVSVSRAAVLDAGGFDEHAFGSVAGDDVELGLRLALRGQRIVFRGDCVARSNRATDPAGFVARAFDAARAVARMHALHGDIVPCWPQDPVRRERLEDSIVGEVEASFEQVGALIDSFERVEAEFRGEPLSAEELATAGERLIELAEVYRLAGLHHERTAVDLLDCVATGAPGGTTVSLLVAGGHPSAAQSRCVRSLTDAADERFIQELIEIDRTQPLGGLRASGEWVALLEPEIVAPRGWLDRALYHGAADPRVGAIVLRTDHASDTRRIGYEGPADAPSLDRFAARHAEQTGRRGEDVECARAAVLFIRRAALDELGGLDAVLAGWLAGEDLAARLRSVGWRTRLALDSCVHRGEATPGAADGAVGGSAPDPELSILVLPSSWGEPSRRSESLTECLSSIEAQDARGRFEVVAVDDGWDDETRERVAAWEPGIPVRVVRATGGRAVARNAGLAATRAGLVLLLDDRSTAAPDLVSRHLATHARLGPNAVVLGAVTAPPQALDNALVRVSERIGMGGEHPFPVDSVSANSGVDWTHFRALNVSLWAEMLLEAASFHDGSRDDHGIDGDLGYQLEDRGAARMHFEPTASVECQRVLDLPTLRDRTRSAAAAYVRFFREHPAALHHRDWRDRASNTVADSERLLVGTLPDRARAEAFVAELSAVDLGALEATGPGGAQLAAILCDQLEPYLVELRQLWWTEGECEGMRAAGIARMRDVRGSVAPALAS